VKQYNILGGVDEMDEEGNVKRVNCNPPLFRVVWFKGLPVGCYLKPL